MAHPGGNRTGSLPSHGEEHPAGKNPYGTPNRPYQHKTPLTIQKLNSVWYKICLFFNRRRPAPTAMRQLPAQDQVLTVRPLQRPTQPDLLLPLSAPEPSDLRSQGEKHIVRSAPYRPCRQRPPAATWAAGEVARYAAAGPGARTESAPDAWNDVDARGTAAAHVPLPRGTVVGGCGTHTCRALGGAPPAMRAGTSFTKRVVRRGAPPLMAGATTLSRFHSPTRTARQDPRRP